MSMLQPAPAKESRFSLRVYEKGLEEEAEALEKEIRKELRSFMHTVEKDEKSYYRDAHLSARLAALEKHKGWLQKHWPKYCMVFAHPWEVTPDAICPRLELVENQRQNDIFRIARLTWSLPYSRGYGRRLDYLLWDDNNGKIMGILGLQSAPISLPIRDRTFHIPYEQKIEIVNQTMDVYTLGALPPYSELLTGKLLVMAAASRDIRQDYEQRYQGRVTEMLSRVLPTSLIAVTTLSAFGRSSLYNRVSKGFDGKHNVWAALSLGPCEGWGTFHLSDELYQKMKQFHQQLWPEKPVQGFGTGPRIRQQIITRILQELRLPKRFARHNIGREVFIIPHVENLQAILAGVGEEPIYNDNPFATLAAFWKERYCLPRASTRCSIEGKTAIATALGLSPQSRLTENEISHDEPSHDSYFLI
jgi:hypothetical protein